MNKVKRSGKYIRDVWNIRSFFSILLAFTVSLTLAGCQSEQPTSTEANAVNSNENAAPKAELPANDNSPAVNNADTANVAANAANNNLKPQEIAEIPPPPEGGPTPISMTEAKKRRLEQFRNSDGTGLPPGVPTEAGPQVQPAPDNSEYFITLTDVARETRRFKSHSVLDRVEKESDGKNVKITAFLKDGKKVSIDPGRISNFPKATAAQFLGAAGIKQ
ncbi:MAG: hypothetical protein KF855_12525 [Acidobacteria bacterium]|nr:hypothetical protein [Acidobacteriota bacterium]